MKPVVARIYGIMVFLTLLGLIAWTGADWYQQRTQAQERGMSVLRELAGRLADRSIHRDLPGVPTVAAVMGSLANPEGRWKTLVLATDGSGTDYYRGPRPSVPADQEVPRWSPKPLTETEITVPVFRADGGPQTLGGIYEFYGRPEVFSALKACGFTLFILVILTTIVVFLDSRPRQPVSDARPETEPVLEPSPSRTQTRYEEDWEVPPSLDFDVPEMDHAQVTWSESEDEYWFDDELTMEDLPPLDDQMDRADQIDQPRQAEPGLEPKSGNKPSLFSPSTGLGWEDYLATRLSFELDRSASQNLDLALVLLVPKERPIDPELWGQSVKEAFPSADLDFEFQGGAAVILPGQSLEQALRAARSFVDSSDRHLPGLVVHAGVAARTGRLLSGDTLLAEAESAKRRSLAGSVRVLGLKTDPDRYRQHLASASA